MTNITQFQNNNPYIACIRSNDVEYVGIIINSDDSVISIYDITLIRSDEEKSRFMELGQVWWWESNRKIPISIFLKQEMIAYRYTIKTFNSKDIELVFGYAVNLSDIAEKRIKRKSIQLVRIPKN